MSIIIRSNKTGGTSEWGFSGGVLPNAGVYEIAVKVGGEVVSSPIEEGSFATYNKTTEPMEISATLAFSGTDNFLQSVLDELKTLQQSVTVFDIKTPIQELRNVALQNYDYSMRREDGRGSLYVSCTFIEIKEVSLTYTSNKPITDSKDSSSLSCVDNGNTQTENITDDAAAATSERLASQGDFS